MAARLWLILIFVSAQCGQGATRDAAPSSESILLAVDIPHPACSAPIDLHIGRDYFTSILNDLPGRDEYNSLVSAYQRADWASFDKEIDQFKKVYETSALAEAAHFLILQVAIDRADSISSLEATERQFRELLLLYPKSNLVPVITASMANSWMRHEKYDRSLALYESGRMHFSESPLRCVNLMGIAESQFQMNQLSEAKITLAKTLTDCFNRRVRTAAQIRQLNIESIETKVTDNSGYEKILATAPIAVAQYYPWVIHNISEKYYQEKKYDRARFYFGDYMRQPLATPECLASAQKRLADISARLNQPLATVVEQYFKVADIEKNGRYAAFSYLHGLLAGYRLASEKERSLRLSVFDKEIENVKDRTLRSVAFLEKGLVALEAMDARAIGYLVRFHDREKEAGGFTIDQGPIAKAIQQHLATIIHSADKLGGEALLDLQGQLSAVERIWGKTGHNYAPVLRSNFEYLLESGRLEGAIETAGLWKTLAPVSQADRLRITAALWGRLKTSEKEAELIWSQRSVLEPLTSDEHLLFWYGLASRRQDGASLLELEKQFKARPVWVMATSPVTKNRKEALWELARGSLLERLGKSQQALQVYANIRDPQYEFEVISRRFAIARHLNDHRAMLATGPKLIELAPKEEKGLYLGMLIGVIQHKRLWPEVKKLEAVSKSWDLAPDQSAQFDFLAANAAYEMRNYPSALEKYERVLKEYSGTADASEAFFKLGKCLAVTGNLDRAKEVWGGLVAKNDSFWSPLAANELTLVDRQPASKK